MIPPGMIRGMTLIELVIVMTLLSVLAIMAVPVFDGADSMALDSAMRRLREDIRYAQEWAVGHYVETSVDFDAVGNSYAIYQNGELLPLDDLGVQLGSGVLEGISILSVNLTGGTAVTFSEVGEAQTSGTILLGNTLSETAVLTIEPFTGAVSYQWQ